MFVLDMQQEQELRKCVNELIFVERLLFENLKWKFLSNPKLEFFDLHCFLECNVIFNKNKLNIDLSNRMKKLGFIQTILTEGRLAGIIILARESINYQELITILIDSPNPI